MHKRACIGSMQLAVQACCMHFFCFIYIHVYIYIYISIDSITDMLTACEGSFWVHLDAGLSLML